MTRCLLIIKFRTKHGAELKLSYSHIFMAFKLHSSFLHTKLDRSFFPWSSDSCFPCRFFIRTAWHGMEMKWAKLQGKKKHHQQN